ncbi:hypothetical protein FO519_000474 [Halicephalobus sp. NKZ332]|nr:hypothetical protein FO519_000474 [Halicephalobus sp. NKZ332]
MSTQGSPGTKNLVFSGRDKAAEVAKRRELQEKEREAKLEVKRKEQEEKLRRVAEQKNHELVLRMKLKAQRELERSKAALDRRTAQLEQDKARKQEILQKAHLATSRTAQTSPKKVFAFGSSTPRELSYLEKLSKDQKQYDKRLLPSDAGKSPTSSPPREVKKPSTMTASLYVPAKTSPQKVPINRPRRSGVDGHKSTPTKSPAMTQSLYVPSSKKVPPVRSVPKPSPPKRSPPSRESKKPPLPVRAPQKTPEKKSPQVTPVPKAIISRKSVQATNTLPALVESPRNPEAVAASHIVESVPIVLDTENSNVSAHIESGPVPQENDIEIKEETQNTEVRVDENEQILVTPVKEVQLIDLPSPVIPDEDFVNEEQQYVEDSQKSESEQVHLPENQSLDVSSLLESIAEPVPITPEEQFSANEDKEEEHHIDEMQPDLSSIIFETQASDASAVVEHIPVDPIENVSEVKHEQHNDENQEKPNTTVLETVQSQESKEENSSIKIEPTEILANGDVSIERSRIESPDSGNALSTSSSPKESDSENTEISLRVQENNLKNMERRARLSEIMSKVREANGSPKTDQDTSVDSTLLAKQLLEQRRQGRSNNDANSGSDLDLSVTKQDDNNDVTAQKNMSLSLSEEIKEAQRRELSSDVLPGQPIYNGAEYKVMDNKSNLPDDPQII